MSPSFAVVIFRPLLVMLAPLFPELACSIVFCRFTYHADTRGWVVWIHCLAHRAIDVWYAWDLFEQSLVVGNWNLYNIGHLCGRI